MRNVQSSSYFTEPINIFAWVCPTKFCVRFLFSTIAYYVPSYLTVHYLGTLKLFSEEYNLRSFVYNKIFLLLLFPCLMIVRSKYSL
jgi:hypothetical protein